MSRPRPRDHAQRERAVLARDANVVVLAGAGSGKTSLLCERVLHLVIGRGIDAARIAAITFTENAASQMRDRLAAAFDGLASGGSDVPVEAERVRVRLASAGSFPVAAAEIRRRARAALAALDRASIATIHGFCARLLRRHPVQAGVAPGFDVDADFERDRRARDLFLGALRSICTAAATRDRAEAILGTLTVEDLRELFVGLLGGTVPRGAPGRDLLSVDRTGELLRRHLFRLAGELRPFLSPRPTTRYATLLGTVLQRLEHAIEHGPRDIPSLPPLGLVPRPGKGDDPEGRDALATAVRFLDNLAETDDALLVEAIDVLAPEVERARAAVEGEGLLSFDDLLVRSRNLLRDHPAVRRREADALQAILVDEIQDTDPLQYEIVFMLAESAWVRPARDPWSVRLAPGRLFVVGDPKQSIFRFRGADVAAFDRALRVMEGQGADVLMLQSSFRSPRAILDPLDRLFAPWLGPKDELEREWSAAPSYHAIRAERAAPDPAFGCGPRIEIWSLPADLAAGARRVAEGRAIATHIAAAVSNGLRYEDHAILLAAFSDVAAYARALDRAGIPFTLEGGRTFYERPEVTDLLALLRALAEPNDRVALLSFLRSPVGAVPDAELLRHVESGGAIAVDGEPDPASLPALARSLGLYRRLARRISGVPVDEAVRAVIGETRLMEIHAAGFDGAQRVANLRKIEALAADLSRDRFLSLSGLVRDLEAREKSSGGEGEPALADEGLDAVRIVTVHRAKGLEFPVVFVADMARHDREGAQESHAGYTEREPGPGLAVRLLGAHVQSTLGALARGTEEVHRPAEHRRLLYVAATRARERLVLIAGSARGTRSSWVEALRSWGYDPRTPPRDGERLLGSRVLHRSIADDVTAPPRRAIAAPDLHAPAAAFLSAARSVRAVRRMGSPTALREEREAARSEEHALSRPVAFAIGLTVHAALEAMDFADPSPALAYGRVLALASRASDQHGVDPATVAPAAARILESFASGRLRARLAAARIVGREVPLIARNPDGRPEVMTGIADVVFEERGEIVVADWKTDLVGDDALVAAAVDRYRPQVAWYAEALSRSLDRPVAAELFFLTRDLGVRV